MRMMEIDIVSYIMEYKNNQNVISSIKLERKIKRKLITIKKGEEKGNSSPNENLNL